MTADHRAACLGRACAAFAATASQQRPWATTVEVSAAGTMVAAVRVDEAAGDPLADVAGPLWDVTDGDLLSVWQADGTTLLVAGLDADGLWVAERTWRGRWADGPVDVFDVPVDVARTQMAGQAAAELASVERSAGRFGRRVGLDQVGRVLAGRGHRLITAGR